MNGFVYLFGVIPLMVLAISVLIWRAGKRA
jgi:hypothetical protein